MELRHRERSSDGIAEAPATSRARTEQPAQAAAAGGRVSAALRKKIQVRLDKMLDADYTGVFAFPVDEERDNAPGYYTKVPHPLSLQQIVARFTNDEYMDVPAAGYGSLQQSKRVHTLRSDLALVAANAARYNGADHAVALLGQRMLNEFGHGSIFPLLLDPTKLGDDDTSATPISRARQTAALDPLALARRCTKEIRDTATLAKFAAVCHRNGVRGMPVDDGTVAVDLGRLPEAERRNILSLLS